MEFKVGDKVEILDRIGDESSYHPRYTDIKKITGIDSLILDNNNYHWYKKAVKLVNEEKYLHPSELKDGDFIKISGGRFNFEYIYIFKEYKENNIYRYISVDLKSNTLNIDSYTYWNYSVGVTKITYATEEEKNLLNEALLKEGYIWDNTTKQLLKVGTATLSSDIGIPEQTDLYYTDTAIKPTAIYNGIPIYSADAIANLKEKSKEELNLFPTKKHYQLNFNY